MTSGDPTIHEINNFYYFINIFHDFTINLFQNRFSLWFSETFENTVLSTPGKTHSSVLRRAPLVYE